MILGVFDWSLLAVSALGLVAMALRLRRYSRSVAHFLSAGRCSGRYLLTMAQGVAGIGVVYYLANYEKIYRAGFGDVWWSVMLMLPVMMVMGLVGWVVYRYRETRAMTMAQFFEMRYSRRFRIFAGFLAFAAGLLNYALFPQLSANFFVHYCGLPEIVEIGALAVPTRAVVMFIFLSIAVWLVLGGGLITIIVTGFVQGQVMNIIAVVLIGFLLYRFGLGGIMETLQQAPEGQSMVDPFNQSGVDSFTWSFFVMMIFLQMYGRGVWQGVAAMNTAARTPHEARMAGILAQWRDTINYALLLIIPISAYVIMHSPEWTGQMTLVQDRVSELSDPQLQKQMLVPMAMSVVLPPGLLGLFAVLFFMGVVTTDNTSLHAWGGIFIQDVLMPFRKKPLTQKQHIQWLRIAVVGVAVFSFFWSLFFPLKEFIWMYMWLTGAVYLGGAGSVVIGGLYWKRGTLAGAWAAMIVGSSMALCGIVARTCWHRLPVLSSLAPECPLNGVQISFATAILSILSYVVVSLMTRNPDGFELDKLLHRGMYDTRHEHEKKSDVTGWQRRLGISQEFTRGDRFIYFFNIGWAFTLLFTFILGGVVRLFVRIPEWVWTRWWAAYFTFLCVMTAVTTVWFLLGGVRDLADLFKRLAVQQIDESDDGRVTHD